MDCPLPPCDKAWRVSCNNGALVFNKSGTSTLVYAGLSTNPDINLATGSVFSCDAIQAVTDPVGRETTADAPVSFEVRGLAKACAPRPAAWSAAT